MMRSVIAAILLTCCASAQQPAPPPALRGAWAATAGPKQVYRGSWSAQVLTQTANRAQGSWALLNATNQIVLEGTWSAGKSARGWDGTWSARVVTRQSGSGRAASGRSGQAFSGTWQAAAADSKNKTLADMLQSTLEKQVSGSWQSGRQSGNWSLRGSR
jgi:hypothetical protein